MSERCDCVCASQSHVICSCPRPDHPEATVPGDVLSEREFDETLVSLVEAATSREGAAAVEFANHLRSAYRAALSETPRQEGEQ